MTGKVVSIDNTFCVVTGLIDEIYKKERMYIRNYDKDNILTVRSPIFELQKFHNLKSSTGVELH